MHTGKYIYYLCIYNKIPIYRQCLLTTVCGAIYIMAYPKIPELVLRKENGKWYIILPLDTVVEPSFKLV